MFESLFAQALAPAPIAAAAAANRPEAVDAANAKAKARAAAEDYESVFLTQFVEEMFSDIDTEGPFGGGHGEKIYRSMLGQEYAKDISKRGGIGIADQVYAELLKAQGLEP